VGLTLVLCGCASSTAKLGRRNEVIRRILPSTVQLRCEREGGGRRAASGIVLASDSVARRSWILTTRHFLDPPTPQEIHLGVPDQKKRFRAKVVALSDEADLAVLEAEGVVLPAVRFKVAARLGDDVWVVAFPWGRRLTLVSGVVSQIVSESGEAAIEGPALMVDASVSYGASGGGVFDAPTGALIGVVESHRTARVTSAPDRVLEIPVPGETTIIPSTTITRFLDSAGLQRLVQQ
jgi:serine protease Do